MLSLRSALIERWQVASAVNVEGGSRKHPEHGPHSGTSMNRALSLPVSLRVSVLVKFSATSLCTHAGSLLSLAALVPSLSLLLCLSRHDFHSLSVSLSLIAAVPHVKPRGLRSQLGRAVIGVHPRLRPGRPLQQTRPRSKRTLPCSMPF